MYVAETDEVFFASNAGGDLGMSDWDHNNVVSKISLAAVESALLTAGEGATKVDVPYTTARYVFFLPRSLGSRYMCTA